MFVWFLIQVARSNMIRKSLLCKLFSRPVSQTKTFIFGSGCCLSTLFCTIPGSPEIPESAEIPSWFRSIDDGTVGTESLGDEFVIPPLASRTEDPGQRHRLPRVATVDLSGSDVDKVYKVLKTPHSCPEAVVKALDECDVEISNGLVEKLLKKCCNNWIPAAGVFMWAKLKMGGEYPAQVYDLMVDIFGRAKKFDLMWKLVEGMKELEGLITLETMGKVMRRLARAGNYQDAVEAFNRLEQFGLERNASAMNLLMDALVKENGVEHAHEAFSQFKESISGDVRSYNILIHGYCRCKKFEQAREVMKEMEVNGLKPDVYSYTCFVETYSHEKEFRLANAVVEEMQAKGCMPNSVTYTILMQALGKAKQIKDALEVYERMKSNGCLADSSFYSSLMYTLSKAGRFKDAWNLYENMDKDGVKPDLLTYNTLISVACAYSQEETALRILTKMEQDNCKPNLQTYGYLLKMCCRNKRIRIIRFLLDHMFKNDVSIDLSTYNLLVHGLCKSGNIEEACIYFEEMVQMGFVPWVSTSRLLLQKLKSITMEKEKKYIENLLMGAQQHAM
ncbi:hypothetical protein MLD38_008626 [Melastoma candidum]|uniref:Uncharacterized protein n=1 Tax=Melastoma candidum TaxID=119954 RepID=A0ACB9RUJ1_9MYRT|nr:hypothetical protein MLD38_008626 [Melastoma candidum]